jgi:polyferredoxin
MKKSSLPNTDMGAKKTHTGKRSLFSQRTLRVLAQLVFASFILYLVVQKSVVGESGSSAVTSAEAYCPFGGLETLFKYFTAGGTFVAHTHLSNIVLLVAVLFTAVLFRSAFCGWVCPLGFLQDILAKVGNFFQKKVPGIHKVVQRIKGHTSVLSVLDRYLRYVKYLVLIWAIGGSMYFGYMVFRDYDPWATLLNIAEFSFTPGVIVLGLIILSSFFVSRPWCRYACPLGAASGLAGKVSPMSIQRDEDICINCEICTKSCPMGLKVHSVKTVQSTDCNACLECVGACPVKGALNMKIGIPFRKR